MDFDSNPYAETDEEREKRLLEEFRAAEQAARDRKAKEGIEATNAALAKSGAEYRVPDDVVAAQQRFQGRGGVNQDVKQLPPAVAKGMADTDRALEMTGSKYRLPDVEIEHGEPEANPYRETVGQREFNPKASTKQLRSELAEGQNDALDYVTEKGDIQGRGLERQAELAGDLAEQRKQGMSEAQQRVDSSRQVREVMQREAYQRLDKISAMVDRPPDQSRGKVLQIIGAVIGASGKGGGIGAGLQMLGRSMAGDVQGWATEIDANRGALQSMFGAIESQEKGEEHELRMQKAYADLGFGVYEASLAQAQAEAKSEEARAVAGELRNGLRNKYAEVQIDFNERQAALTQKAGAGAAKTEREKQILQHLSSLPLEERTNEAMKIGPDAVALWEKAQKGFAADVGMAKTAADAEKALREKDKDAPAPAGSRVVGGYEIADPQVWGSLGAETKNKFAAGSSRVPGLVKQIHELRDMVKEHGTETLPTAARRKMEAKSASILSGVKEANQLGALDNGVATLVERMTGDVTAWNFGLGNVIEGADVKLDETAQAVIESAKAQAGALGLRPAGSTSDAPPPAPTGPATAAGEVMMVAPSGRSFPVPADPDSIRRAEARGWKLPKMAETSGGER